MKKSTPFIATAPLDILAIIFCALFLLNCLFFSVIITTVVSYWLPIKVEFDIHGYDILITKKSFPQNGYGIMFKGNFKIWHYSKLSLGQIREQKLFAF